MPESVTAAEVVGCIRELHRARQGTLLIAVDGLGGAGKTTLARKIAAEVGDVTVVCLDDFARPTALGWEQDRFVEQVLQPVLNGRPGRYQRWDWDADAPAEWHEVPTNGVLVVEGVSSTRREIGHPWDLTIWVSAPFAVRLRRGVERDGEPMRSVWTGRWMPEEDAYLMQQRPDERADLIVDGTAG
ncbi:MAG: uridine kinase [Actinobacteria bacterium]|nr:MAG: uridine kinase [Actinomycetota bacterium]